MQLLFVMMVAIGVMILAFGVVRLHCANTIQTITLGSAQIISGIGMIFVFSYLFLNLLE